jgi:hypothetical protein
LGSSLNLEESGPCRFTGSLSQRSLTGNSRFGKSSREPITLVGFYGFFVEKTIKIPIIGLLTEFARYKNSLA